MNQRDSKNHLLLIIYEYELEVACHEGDVGKIIMYLDGGESIICVAPLDGATPIMIAMMFSYLHVVQMLVGRGADVTKLNADGWSLLHLAAYGGDRECLEWVFANFHDRHQLNRH
jgi:ankyrin repeat protein